MSSSQNISLIIFDLDGTLVDTAPDLIAAANHCLTLAGLSPVGAELLRPFAGVGASAMLTAGFAHNKQSFLDYKDDLIAPFLAHYEAHIADHSVLFEGMETLLSALVKRTNPLAICTNKPGNLARLLINQLGLASYFPTITGGDDVPFKKPDPRPLLETKKQRAPFAKNALYIGDSDVDIAAAKAAHMTAIGVDYGYSANSLATAKPDYLVQSVGELSHLLMDDLLS